MMTPCSEEGVWRTPLGVLFTLFIPRISCFYGQIDVVMSEYLGPCVYDASSKFVSCDLYKKLQQRPNSLFVESTVMLAR